MISFPLLWNPLRLWLRILIIIGVLGQELMLGPILVLHLGEVVILV